MLGHMMTRIIDFGLRQLRGTFGSRSRQQDAFQPLYCRRRGCSSIRIVAGCGQFPIGQCPGKTIAIGRVFEHHGILGQENHVNHARSMIANQDMGLSHQGHLVGKTQGFQGYQRHIGNARNVVLQMVDQVGQIGQVAALFCGIDFGAGMRQVGSTINNGNLAGNHAEVGQVQSGHYKIHKGMHHTGTLGALFPQRLTFGIQDGRISSRNQGGIGQTHDGMLFLLLWWWWHMICRCGCGTRGNPRSIWCCRKGRLDKVGGSKQLPPGRVQGSLGMTIQENNRHVVVSVLVLVLVGQGREGWCGGQGQKGLEPISNDKVHIAIFVSGNQQDASGHVMGTRVASSSSRCCCGSGGSGVGCRRIVICLLHNFQMLQNVVNVMKVWSFLSFWLHWWTLLVLLGEAAAARMMNRP